MRDLLGLMLRHRDEPRVARQRHRLRICRAGITIDLFANAERDSDDVVDLEATGEAQRPRMAGR
jgi:hypothetical protein